MHYDIASTQTVIDMLVEVDLLPKGLRSHIHKTDVFSFATCLHEEIKRGQIPSARITAHMDTRADSDAAAALLSLTKRT
jgi:hypothetical protein